MATMPLCISSAIVCISVTKSIQLLLKPFENAKKAFGHAKRMVSVRFEYLETPSCEWHFLQQNVQERNYLDLALM
jgi:hypothetical protein